VNPPPAAAPEASITQSPQSTMKAAKTGWPQLKKKTKKKKKMLLYTYNSRYNRYFYCFLLLLQDCILAEFIVRFSANNLHSLSVLYGLTPSCCPPLRDDEMLVT
jgi:hypothetical protein